MVRKRRSGGGEAKGKPKLAGRAADRPDSDYLLDAAHEHWPHILTLYQCFEDKKPVMLFDMQEQRIYAYPYAEFRGDLSAKSQRSLKDQYERAVRENKIVVFVRDNERRRLVSFSLPQV